MEHVNEPIREFEITIKGRVHTIAGGSGDFGWSDLSAETEIETTLSPVVGTPPNVEGAIELYERMQQDDQVFELLRRSLPPSIKFALDERRQHGRD